MFEITGDKIDTYYTVPLQASRSDMYYMSYVLRDFECHISCKYKGYLLHSEFAHNGPLKFKD